MGQLANIDRATIAAGACLLALLAAPATAFSQQDVQQLAERQRQIVSEIERIESARGPQARELIEPLTALSLLYEEAGDYRSADPTIQRLLQVLRANYGLYTLEQVPSIRQLLAHELERGNAAEAWELEQSMLTLAERNLDDVRSASILRETADRRMSLLERYNAGEFPAEIILGCYYLESGPAPRGINARGTTNDSCTSGSRRIVQENLLGEAQNYYSQAINILLGNDDFASDELPGLLMDLVDSSYRYSNPTLGRRSLHYLLAYQATNAVPLADRIETLVRIADWDLFYARGSNDSQAALAQYEEALGLLEDTPAARAWIERNFSPEIPIRLPGFYPNPLETAAEGSYGHVDVAFAVDARGRSRRVRILETTENAPAAAAKELEQLVLRSRFRPQLVDGRFDTTDTIVVRYYLTR